MMRHLMISPGEFHWIQRRRAGHTVEGWSEKTGRTPDQIRDIEFDRSDAARLSAREEGQLANITLSAGEFCALARRRCGMKMDEVAKRTGVSRMTVWKQEHDMTATARDLAKWWMRRRFPDAPSVDRHAVWLAPELAA